MPPLLLLLLLLLLLPLLAGAASTPLELVVGIDEELEVGQQVADLLQALADSGHPLASGVDTDFRVFNAEPAGAARYFALAAASGRVTVAGRLDRDSLCAQVAACCGATCRLALQVQSDKEFTYIITLRVSVRDLNDNAPAWPTPEIEREFSEASRPGESCSLPLAADADAEEFGVRRYAILPPAPSSFRLHYATRSGHSQPSLRLLLDSELDREQVDAFQFRVAAYDGGEPPLSGVVLLRVKVTDVNDEVPRFQQETYQGVVREDAPVGHRILQVKAIDKDAGRNGEVTYSIPAFAPAKVRRLFSVEARTGELLVAGSLDFERTRRLQFTVVAKDNSRRSRRQGSTQVVVRLLDVNDQPPRIIVNAESVSVRENDRAGRNVAILTVTDADSGDNGKVSCSLADHSDAFRLDGLQEATLYKLVTRRPLDSESDGRRVDVTVSCSDAGTPSFTSRQVVPVTVADVNDNRPTFAMATYSFSVNERERPGGPHLFTIAADDRDFGVNARLSYRLLDTDAFGIDASGRVRLLLPLDREQRDTRSFRVVATDHGRPPLAATASVVVIVEDDNDNWPTVQGYFAFSVWENATEGHPVGRLNGSDLDAGRNAELRYRMADLRPQSAAAAHLRLSDDGRLLVARSIDRERTPRLQFAVEVSDSAETAPKTATTTVVVEVLDVNDCRPRFEFPAPGNRTVRLAASAPVAATVATLRAVDPDEGANGRVFYSLDSPADSPFHVDADTGRLLLVRPLRRSRLDGPLRLLVSATDGGRPPLRTTQPLVVVFATSQPVVRRQHPPDTGILLAAGLVAAAAAFLLILLLGAAMLACWRGWRLQGRSSSSQLQARIKELHTMHSREDVPATVAFSECLQEGATAAKECSSLIVSADARDTGSLQLPAAEPDGTDRWQSAGTERRHRLLTAAHSPDCRCGHTERDSRHPLLPADSCHPLLPADSRPAAAADHPAQQQHNLHYATLMHDAHYDSDYLTPSIV